MADYRIGGNFAFRRSSLRTKEESLHSRSGASISEVKTSSYPSLRERCEKDSSSIDKRYPTGTFSNDHAKLSRSYSTDYSYRRKSVDTVSVKQEHDHPMIPGLDSKDVPEDTQALYRRTYERGLSIENRKKERSRSLRRGSSDSTSEQKNFSSKVNRGNKLTKSKLIEDTHKLFETNKNEEGRKPMIRDPSLRLAKGVRGNPFCERESGVVGPTPERGRSQKNSDSVSSSRYKGRVQ